jgi:hypothetical protein
MRKRPILASLAALVCLAWPSRAAELGVNYYHETLMNSHTNGNAYTQRTTDGVNADLDNIKTIASAVKLYMNPFIDQNLPWIQQVAAQAKQHGMHVVTTMMVDDRQLDDSNWQEYANRVVGACQSLEGRVDGILVGNEIVLHSQLTREEIKNRVVSLMDRCQQRYSGQVSYQEFWYAKDAWAGFNKPLYFMMFEEMDTFRSNMVELGSRFGANGYIGEWGEDLLRGTTVMDESWQKDSIQQRWTIIQQSPAPIAYLFTYREPSATGFGMLRPGDDSRRPLWEVFGATSNPTTQPPPPQPAPSQSLIGSLSVSSSIGSLKSDTNDGSCRTVIYGTGGVDLMAFACAKPDGNIEIYKLEAPTQQYRLCIGGVCIDNANGFARGIPNTTTGGTSPADGITSPPPPTTNKLDVSTLTFQGDGQMTLDKVEETGCRRVAFGATSALTCPKTGQYEIYKQSGSGTICAKAQSGNTACVGEYGFAILR